MTMFVNYACCVGAMHRKGVATQRVVARSDLKQRSVSRRTHRLPTPTPRTKAPLCGLVFDLHECVT